MISILLKLEGFARKRGSFALQEHFPLLLTTKRSCCRGKILGRMENSRFLNRKTKILWQLRNLQNYKDLFGKPRKRDWRAKRLLPIRILLISNVLEIPSQRIWTWKFACKLICKCSFYFWLHYALPVTESVCSWTRTNCSWDVLFDFF